MDNKEKQIKNSFIYLIPVLANGIFPFITIPIFTRILTKEDYGVLALAQVYAVFMAGVANFGLLLSYTRNFFQYHDRKNYQLLYSILLLVILNSLIFALITFIFKNTFSKWIIGTPEHSKLIFWAFCSSAILSLKLYYLSYFKNSEDAKSFVSYTLKEIIMTVVLSFIFVAVFKIGVIGLIWGPLLSNAVVFSALSYKFLKIHRFSFDLKILKDSLKISYPLTPKMLIGVLANQFDKYMIGLLASIGGVGIYSIGQKISIFQFQFMTAIQNVYQPRVYRQMFENGKNGGESIGKYLTPFVYLSIFAAIFISLFSEEIIVILTPESFYGAIDIISILTMYYGYLFFGMVPQLLFAKKTHISSLLNFISILLNIAFNIFFIMRWGAVGAAWATFLAGLISGSLLFAVSQYYYKIKWEYIKIGSIYIIFFICTITILSARHLSVPYEFQLAFKSVSLIIYLYLGNKFEVVTIENFKLVKDMILLNKSNISHEF